MCPRATAEHGGAAMAMTSAHSFGEEEYIDLDLSSCGEYEFRVCRSRAPCAEETPCRGRMHRVAPRPGGKLPHAEATAGSGGGGGRRSTATVAPLQQSHVRSAQPARARAEGRGKAVRARLQASRAFFRSLFARTSCSDHERCRGGAGVPCPSGSVSGKKGPFGQFKNGGSGAGPTTLRSSIEQEKEEEEHAASIRQRKSFSGVIRWRAVDDKSTRANASAASAACVLNEEKVVRERPCGADEEQQLPVGVRAGGADPGRHRLLQADAAATAAAARARQEERLRQ
ncbi:hypothetical protein ACQ4PT_000684 [Festuca glaucescens]